MSQQNAMRFLAQVRQDPDLAERVRGLGEHATLDDLVALAGPYGLAFSTDELQAAFRKDWTMRWLHYTAHHIDD